MDKTELEYAFERIEHMEKLFDETQLMFNNNPSCVSEPSFQKKISLLTQYMESGTWLRDYGLDEKGLLPPELKRGILSEDGLYNFICDVENASKRKTDILYRFFEKDEILFVVLWIIIYVIGFSTADGISETIGIPKLITSIFGFILSAVIVLFAKKNGLLEYFGLCKTETKTKDFLFFIPLAIVSTASIWGGFSLDAAPLAAFFGVISMCFVGFLEEIIFRGMLFSGMAKNGIKSAVIVSSLTFGFGHIINLLMGAPVFETMLQLIYASAAGFCYTAIFYRGKSIIPCIISHAVINSLSIFGAEVGAEGQIIISAVQTAINIGYGIWVLKKCR
ncbi:MAG: DUF4298 domain-containing protein [Oscillospiraceae bacterium]|nr:DUF4298 domain-containing protein [Oscillospiraceae bacterium]